MPPRNEPVWEATAVLDDGRYYHLERWHGEGGARLAADSHTAAIDRIESIVRREAIACGFERVDGYLFLGEGCGEDELELELAAAHRAGLHDVAKIGRAPLAWDTGPCLRFPNQGQFHPLKYLAGLAVAIERDGGRIHSRSPADAIEGGQPATVTTRGGVVTAGAVVVATNTPMNDLVVIHTKQAPYLSYVIGMLVPRGAIGRALFWDTADPYHYVRLQSLPDGDHDVLIVGGEDHKTGQADDGDRRHARLEAWARERFPMAGELACR